MIAWGWLALAFVAGQISIILAEIFFTGVKKGGGSK